MFLVLHACCATLNLSPQPHTAGDLSTLASLTVHLKGNIACRCSWPVSVASYSGVHQNSVWQRHMPGIFSFTSPVHESAQLFSLS